MAHSLSPSVSQQILYIHSYTGSTVISFVRLTRGQEYEVIVNNNRVGEHLYKINENHCKVIQIAIIMLKLLQFVLLTEFRDKLFPLVTYLTSADMFYCRIIFPGNFLKLSQDISLLSTFRPFIYFILFFLFLENIMTNSCRSRLRSVVGRWNKEAMDSDEGENSVLKQQQTFLYPDVVLWKYFLYREFTLI